ncbi:urease subunit beta [Brevibacterium marinum]|uniref:Urease subunit beta n=2 Tax=Brevibacterium marinum TaxID=418643 RepID=A0A846S0E5_9MICO|nr:urease subunit beta [Brevibacterium marinum]NJC55092.1 urease subunit beta [Brevibacterium marinum]
MSNERGPAGTGPDEEKRGTNPFENEELQPEHRDTGAEHPSDHPGRDYDYVEATVVAEPGIEERQRHPSSGPSGPSEPRRPGSGSRQGPREESEAPVTAADTVVPGQIFLRDEPVEVNMGLAVTTLRVANVSDRPIQVGSHFHFAEVNPGLEFDRERSWGKRLNVLSGGAMRFEPGADEEVELVPFQGARIALGFRGECRGELDG